jgi:transposase
MAPRLSNAVVLQIEHALQQPGINVDEILINILATNFKTTTRTIRYHKLRIEQGRAFGGHKGGPRRVITSTIEASIFDLLNCCPWMYLDEIQDFLLEVFNITVDISTISRALQRIKVTRKKLRIEAAQRNPELRLYWMDQMQFFEAIQIVYVDETGSDERTGDRTYGWAKRGARAKVQQYLAYRTRVSALAAYTIDGYLACRTYEGTGTGDIFESFIIDHLLPLCSPYPGPRSVIVLDNAAIHHKHIHSIEAACLRKGVWIKFLPPYSPDFNPIKESFNDLKSFIRRKYRKKKSQFDSYQGFLEWAIKQVGRGSSTAKRARAHFRNADIRGVPNEDVEHSI